ncbi:MAG: bifunctional 5,10-methylenetetrahydrofolate dehydrogenase/5,10-methenyltetrahydrofolate cyclohydrolase [Oscillospiraceae bacterium]|nr:bifunctional 5,10-methylenetetrahydrofolate dehydrogenase/5,10-methenyltetrahydrofolate cyclohydrolase [Oscillospiraceae bacterium]
MAKLLLGKEVADALSEELKARVQQLEEQGITPTLAVVRVGENAGDLSYEKGAMKRAQQLGVQVRQVHLPEDTAAERLLETMDELNADAALHGVLLFRPLPEHLRSRESEICNRLDPQKDVDGMTDLSAAGVYTGQALGFPPCTAAACMEILDHYGIETVGKKVVVMGRSLVIGRPAALMLMHRHATITVIHTRTEDPMAYIPYADILICAAGVKDLITAGMVRPGQVVLDVSMNYDPDKITSGGRGGMVGDCAFSQVEPIVGAITPVPGGVGAVTNTVLMKHVIQAAQQA